MQANDSWIAMFRRIPGNLQDVLSLGLNTGAEIVVQKIIKLEPDFMIVRGRVAGTQDTGRIVLIPYAEITLRDDHARLEGYGRSRRSSAKGGPTVAADIALSSTEDAPLGDPAAEQPAAEPLKAPEPPPAASLARHPARRRPTPPRGPSPWRNCAAA